MEDTTYFNPKSGHVGSDARQANFKKLAETRIKPISLMDTHAAMDSALHEGRYPRVK